MSFATEWLSQANYLGAFLVGLLGGVHCFGMCGGIVAALSFNTQVISADSLSTTRATAQTSKPASQLSVLFGYNLGRLLAYSFAGAILGGLGAGVVSLLDIQQSRRVLSVIAALFMIALGLYLAGLWQGISYLEKGGHYLWKWIEPLSRRFIPARHFYQAVPLGLVWGWLPCGLVYTVLIWTLSAGSALQGATLMLAFGLGTLPNLLAMGLLAQKLTRWVHNRWVRRLAGGLIAGLGLWMLLRIL